MIFLDAERFIDESIRSVIAQTHQDWELILVDDGSSDASSTIAQRWARRDPRISYVEHEGHANLGMSTSRNRGIVEAHGRLVAFLDSDDVWMPSALSHRLRVLDAHPTAEAMVGGTWRWYSWTLDADDARLDNKMALPPALPRLQVVEPVDAFLGVYASPDVWYVPAMCSLIIRRDRLLALGGMIDEFAGLYEDQVLYTKVLLGLRLVFDERVLSLYRQHDASACAAAIRAGQWHPVVSSPARDRFLTWLADYVASRSGDAAVRRVLEFNLAARAAAGSTTDARLGTSRPLAPGHASEARRRRSRIGALAKQTIGCVALFKRRTQLLLGRRRDVARLLDIWTKEHTSGWPNSSVTVANVPRRRWLTAGRCLRKLRRQLDDTRTVIAMVPARRCGRARLYVPWPIEATLVRDARRAFPGSTIAVEPFGNDRIRRALAAGARVDAIPRVELDRHDRGAPLMLALSIEAPPSRRGER